LVAGARASLTKTAKKWRKSAKNRTSEYAQLFAVFDVFSPPKKAKKRRKISYDAVEKNGRVIKPRKMQLTSRITT
jgi:hypothetical protein